MSKDLPTYEEYQRRKNEAFETLSKQWQPAGMLCPQCRIEELEYDSFIELPSYPPQRDVRCPRCKWSGTTL